MKEKTMNKIYREMMMSSKIKRIKRKRKKDRNKSPTPKERIKEILLLQRNQIVNNNEFTDDVFMPKI